jgi:hypothetical protein
MEKRSSQIPILIALIAIPVLVLIAIWIIALNTRPSPVSVPSATFLDNAGIEATFESSLPEPVRGSEIETPYPLLQVGDYADPRIIWRDFHPIPSGYRAIDQTDRRVITTDGNLDVVAILDRSTNIPDGIWQDIDVARVDSSGNIYLFDKTKNLVQVLDSSGHYLRRHTDLGWDFFGTELDMTDIQLDQNDRLWIIGTDRIYVIDRAGNLDRIYERRGAPFSRAQQPWTGEPSEDTPVGYTILPSTDPLVPRRDPSEPVVLPVGEFNSFDLAGGAGNQLFYIGQNQNSLIVVFDFDGNERGTIDLAVLGPGDRQFVVGPDGYLYLIDPATRTVIAMDPLGDIVTTIEVGELPVDGWRSIIHPGAAQTRILAPVNCYVDFDGRLIVYDTRNGGIAIYRLREE